MSQAFVPLTFAADSGGLSVNGNPAPPGYYMLFLVNTIGVPSVAPIISIS
jgi:Galactose oxidase-like, Early set domain